jgi:putative transposase
VEELADRSRRPEEQARRTTVEIEEWIVNLRQTHPSWGPWKLRRFLERHHQDMKWPAESTIALILNRRGLITPAKARRRATPSSQPLTHAKEANDVWSIDFKGWFECGNGERCDPLTISDAATRYLLCCQAIASTHTENVQQEMKKLFQKQGIPQRIRSDNGSPFASTGIGGLSRLSVWWIRQGILPERIEPGEPQQNGRHERMHRTLKQETAKPPAASLKQQQKRFDEFRQVYNEERPHEALQGECPADRYRRSEREYSEKLKELEYPKGMELRLTDEAGKFRWKTSRCRLGLALAHQVVGIEPVDDGVQRIWFGPVLLGLLDERKGASKTARRIDSSWPPLQSPSGLPQGRPTAKTGSLK